jgi:hypothetical protein
MANFDNKEAITAVFAMADSQDLDTALPTTTTTSTGSEDGKKKMTFFEQISHLFKRPNARSTANTSTDFIEDGGKESNRGKSVRIRSAPNDGVTRWLSAVFNAVVSFVTQIRTLNRATSTGGSKHVRDFFVMAAIVLCIAFSMHVYASRKIDALRATKEELASCHVCLDTSTIPTPPCALVTETDFTTHKRKMKDLVSLMTDHVNHDDDKCMASFHIGSRACAFAVKHRLTTVVYFNPVEIEAEWAKPPKRYEEPSDFFSGVTLKRERPSSILISHQVLTSTGVLKNETIDMDGDYAAWVSHCLEVLNGTHHELYLRANKKQ